MQTEFIIKAAEAIHHAINVNESEIESLDREIGDGDHFINLKRGCSSVLDIKEKISVLSAEEALNHIGLKLLSTVGGASGPLLASFFIAYSQSEKENNLDPVNQTSKSFTSGVEAIKKRGKASTGEKTMLDVLIPVSILLNKLANENKDPLEIIPLIKEVALKGVLSTRDMIATKGRAANLGERAIGHVDPGAKSCQIMIETVCDLILNDK